MKTAKKRVLKPVEAPTKPKVGSDWNQVHKSTNRTRAQHTKPTGFLVAKHRLNSPCGTAKALCQHLLNDGKYFPGTMKGLPIPEHYSKPSLHPLAKIKLQLFPVDETTRVGLEKDGYHPYLELTLSARKKMTSVIKHLCGKWGGSSIAVGEPILYPYNISKDLASYRWTLNDRDICAGDVYGAIGSPSVFRLRYGWFSDSETKSFGVPLLSIPFEALSQPKGMQKCLNNITEGVHSKGKQIESASEEFKPAIVSGGVVGADKTSNGSVEHMDNEARVDVGAGQSSAPWDDGLTNISIGGLLSEASLKGSFNNCDPKPNGSFAGVPPSQLISDSFDAFIAAQVNHSQGPRLAPHGSNLSILDAEDTCHAFPFQKFSSSSKDALFLGGSAYPQTSCQDAGSKSFKNQNMTEVSIQSALLHGHAHEESETDLSLCPQLFNDESSLGLSGIKWTESLGPFDLGLSSSRKIISGDSLSISRIVS